jgi:GNAT superfamily N-acetyltransferase
LGIAPALAQSKEPIKIGLIQPLSGPIAAAGSYITNAAKIAVERINAKGGVLGRPLELVIEDNKSDPAETRNAAEKLIEDPRIDHVSFTGSVATGRKVYAAASRRMIDAGLELGGKDPAYVAEDAGPIVGTYVLKANQVGLGSHVANAGFMVSPAARGVGVGRAMGEHSLAEARRLGYHAMQFNFVVSTNQTAIRLWERLGFRVVGTLPGAFRHRTQGFVDALVMFRSLDDV